MTPAELLRLRTLRSAVSGVLTVAPRTSHRADIEVDAGSTVETLANVYCDGASGHAPAYAACIAALHNAAPTLLEAAEPTLLLREVRGRYPTAYLVPAHGAGRRVIAWAVISHDAPDVLGSGPTELEALRDALRRLTGPG